MIWGQSGSIGTSQPASMAINSQYYNGRPACQHCGFCLFFMCEYRSKSTSMVTMLPVAEEYKKILLVEPAVADSITGDKWNKYIFRTGRNSSQDAIANAVALDKAGVTIATMAQDSAFGRDGVKAFKDALKKAKIVHEEYLPTNTTDLDAYSIYRVRLVIAVPGSVAGETVHVGAIRANGRAKPVVSIVLDGEYDSQQNYILPMLDAMGLRCSMAIQGNRVGIAGRMTLAQLNAAYANGHEIIHHSYDGTKVNGYANATDFPTQADIAADIAANNAYMAAIVPCRG